MVPIAAADRYRTFEEARTAQPQRHIDRPSSFSFHSHNVVLGAGMRSKVVHLLAASLILCAAMHGSYGAAHALAQARDSNFYYQRGVANRERQDVDQALVDFNEAIRLDPQNAAAYVGRGSVRFDDGVLADFNEAIRLDPQNREAYSRRAFIYSAQRNYEAALSDYDQVIRLDPNDSESFGQRAGIHWNLGNRAEAFMDADESIRLDPQNAVAWFDRGLFHRRAGNSTESEADFARALRLDPSLRHYYQNMR